MNIEILKHTFQNKLKYFLVYICVEHLSFLNAILYVIFMSCWFESFLHNILSMCYEVRTRYNKFWRLTFRRILSQNVLNNTRSSSLERISCFQFCILQNLFHFDLGSSKNQNLQEVKTKERMVRTLLKHSYSTKEKKSVKKLLFNSLKKATTHPSLLIKRRKTLFLSKVSQKREFERLKNYISNWNSHIVVKK